MHPLRTAALLSGLAAAGCQSYAPDPVDLGAHAQRFAARLPDAEAVRAFAARLREQDPAAPAFDPGDGLDLQEARYVALLFHPELRTLRRRAGVARASAAEAGRWADPTLNADFARILADVGHRWLAGGALGLTLPITGRPGLETELADSRHAQALAEARAAEARTLDALDAAWAQWSAARLAADLLADLVPRLVELEGVAARLAAAHVLDRVEARTFSLERIAQQARLVAAQAAVAEAELGLRQVLGLPPGPAIPLVPTVAIPLRIADPTQRLARLADSPGVALARHEHAVAERQLALAVRRQWPELTLLPGFQEEDAQPRAALGFSLPLPLWNRNAREIAEARAGREAAAEALRASLERATQDLARAEVRRDAAVRQRRLVEAELVPLAVQQLEDGRRMAELGRLNTLLILDALSRSHAARALAVDAALAEAEATIAINSLCWPTLAAGERPEASR